MFIKLWLVESLAILIAVLCVVAALEIPEDELETQILSQALVKIVKEIIAPINQTVNVITCNGKGNRLNNLPKYLMKDLNNTMTFTNELRQDNKTFYDRFNEFMSASLLICDEWNIAQDEGNNIDDTLQPKLGSITYVTAEASERYIDAIQETEKKHFPRTLLLVNDDEHLDLKVASFVSENSCNETHLRTINRFSKATRQWESPLFDLKALRSNNHGCPLIVIVGALAPEIIWPSNIDELATIEFSQLSGYFTEILNELARRLNFPIDAKHPDLERINNLDFDMALYGFSRESEAAEYNVPIDLISIYREIIVVIPLGDFYTGLEKLFLPFDLATWLWITATFAIGLIAIMIIVQISGDIRDFVIGHDVSAPTMNLFTAFFGLGQTRLPARNFARFLLMLYIIWCLIIRTAYQGVLFELLTTDGRRQQDMHFGNFIDSNATLHMNAFCELSISDRDYFKRFVFRFRF